MAFTAGCTSISISQGDGITRIDRSLGFARVEITPGTRAVSARIDALGLSDTPVGIGVGISRQEFAALGEDCRVVIWVESAEAADALAPRLRDLNNLCIVNHTKGTEK